MKGVNSQMPYDIEIKSELVEQAYKKMISLDKLSIDAYLVAYFQPEDENYGSVSQPLGTCDPWLCPVRNDFKGVTAFKTGCRRRMKGARNAYDTN